MNLLSHKREIQLNFNMTSMQEREQREEEKKAITANVLWTQSKAHEKLSNFRMLDTVKGFKCWVHDNEIQQLWLTKHKQLLRRFMYVN